MTDSNIPPPNAKDQNLREVYRSVVDYHNNLVHMRFTVAGLYLAGSAFLVNALFGGYQWCGTKIAVCSLGLALTVIVWIIEVRTRYLLKNLGEFGGKIEEKFELESFKVKCAEIKGFFGLMENQPIQPSIPSPKRVVSHTKGLYTLYGLFMLFWLFMLVNIVFF